MDFKQDSLQLQRLRQTILKMVFSAKEGHIPSAFSILEIIYFLYSHCLKFDPRTPKSSERDYFILSKGHAGAALYVVLQEFGFFPEEHLTTYCKPTSILGGHPDLTRVPGVEVCAGSLGHGVAIANGIALGLRQRNCANKVVVLVGDGEMEEGSFWESVMMAKNLDLQNLIIIADYNQSQEYSFKFDYQAILNSFEFNVISVNGHDLEDLNNKVKPLFKEQPSRPTFVLARTEKGHGIKSFLGDRAWHRRTPTEVELQALLEELSK